MHEGKKVSVVVPVYNAAAFLSDCVDSILTQDYLELEIILVNDGSKDDSAEICRKYERLDGRVQYVEQINSGVSVARNTGMAHASGHYLMFVDSDDKLPLSCISRMVKEAEAYDADLVLGGYEIEYADSKKPMLIEEKQVAGKKEIASYFCEHFLEAIASSVWGKLYKKELIRAVFKKEITMGEDLLFNLEYVKGIRSVAAIGRSVYLYNQTNPNSLVRNYKQSYYEQDKYVCLQWIDWVEECGMLDKATNMYSHISGSFYTFLLSVVQNKDKKNVQPLIRDAIDDELILSISNSINEYKLYQKLILNCVKKRNVGLSIFWAKTINRLKKILK